MNEKLLKILKKVLDEEESAIKKADNFMDLEFWDSLMYVQLVTEIQSEFKLTLTKEDVLALLTLKGIESVLSQHGITE